MINFTYKGAQNSWVLFHFIMKKINKWNTPLKNYEDKLSKIEIPFVSGKPRTCLYYYSLLNWQRTDLNLYDVKILLVNFHVGWLEVAQSPDESQKLLSILQFPGIWLVQKQLSYDIILAELNDYSNCLAVITQLRKPIKSLQQLFPANHISSSNVISQSALRGNFHFST